MGLLDGETGLVEGETGLVEGETGLVEGETGLVEGETGLVEGETGLVKVSTRKFSSALTTMANTIQRRKSEEGNMAKSYSNCEKLY